MAALGLLCLSLAACQSHEPNPPQVGTDLALPSPTQGQAPNVVLIFADDLGYGDLGSFGHPYIRTPHLDQMAREGQRWTDFYVASPVCSPSRAALLTGRLPVRSGLYGDQIGVYFPGEPGGLPAAEVTLAETLKAQGYRTGIFGKWHLGDAPHAWPTRHGFDIWLGLPYSNDMDWVGLPTIDEVIALRRAGATDQLSAWMVERAEKYAEPRVEYWDVPLYSSVARDQGFTDLEVERPVDQTTLTRRYTEAAIEFIKASDRPFFLYLPYTMPHTPLFRSPEFAGRSLGGRYGDVIEEIDWSVGRIRQVLRDLGRLKNTLIVFTSDNGPWLTMRTEGGLAGLLRMGKGTTFEGGVRVPTIISLPGTVKPGVVSELGSTLDLFTTIAGFAGASAVTAVDGHDLRPVLTSGRGSPRNGMPFYRGSTLYAYREGPWKLHLVTQGAYGQPPQLTVHDTPLLYHLGDDPAERFDVAAQHPQVVERLLERVVQLRDMVPIAAPLMDVRLAQPD